MLSLFSLSTSLFLARTVLYGVSNHLNAVMGQLIEILVKYERSLHECKYFR